MVGDVTGRRPNEPHVSLSKSLAVNNVSLWYFNLFNVIR